MDVLLGNLDLGCEMNISVAELRQVILMDIDGVLDTFSIFDDIFDNSWRSQIFLIFKIWSHSYFASWMLVFLKFHDLRQHVSHLGLVMMLFWLGILGHLTLFITFATFWNLNFRNVLFLSLKLIWNQLRNSIFSKIWNFGKKSSMICNNLEVKFLSSSLWHLRSLQSKWNLVILFEFHLIIGVGLDFCFEFDLSFRAQWILGGSFTFGRSLGSLFGSLSQSLSLAL